MTQFYLNRIVLLSISLLFFVVISAPTVYAQSFQNGSIVEGVGTGADRTADKPQSKCWHHDGAWWSALAAQNEFSLYKFDGSEWTKELALIDSRIGFRADCLSSDEDVYILAFATRFTQILKLTYDGNSYQLAQGWDSPAEAPLFGETATIAKDSNGILWIATDESGKAVVYHSEDDGKTWTGPVIVQEGIASDDITAITRLNSNQIALLWSDQQRDEFGLAIHTDGDAPDSWAVEALQGDGPISDDHINIAVSSDGTLYAAVKTEYDEEGRVQLGVYHRSPSGEWSDIAPITVLSATESGTRPIVILNEERNEIYAFYTNWAVTPNSIGCKVARLDEMQFSNKTITVMENTTDLNNTTSTKQIVSSSTGLMILAAPENGRSIDYCYIQNFITLSESSCCQTWLEFN